MIIENTMNDMKQFDPPKTFVDYLWDINYRTSSLKCDGEPVNILHDFYIPVLARAVQYDRNGGFFNPHSLAAASQGMTAFRQPNSHARLIVQTDYTPQQVQTVLDEYTLSGNQEHLAALLNEKLDEFDALHQNVQNGLHLLAGMIKNDALTLRIAFRINCKTGKAAAFDSCEDGYIHSDWGIFKDSAENRICITGALNISANGLSLNTENIDVYCEWKNEENLKRIKNAEYEFELLWDDLNPYIRVLPLPESVYERFFKIAEFRGHVREIDGSESKMVESPFPSAIERLKFALIKDGPKLPGGRLAGIETLPITLLPHQEISARTLIESWPYSYVLCDDSGIEKSSEIGAVVRSLYLSGIAERVLIVAPGTQTEKWQREMAGRFFLPFAVSRCDYETCHDYILPLEEQVKSVSIYDPDLNITAIGLVNDESNENDLLTADYFDIMILDAAHKAGRNNIINGYRSAPDYNPLYKTIAEDIGHKCRSVYLMMDSPMQFDLLQIHDLLKLTNRLGPFQHEPRLFRWFLDIAGDISRNRQISDSEWDFARKAVLKLKHSDPYFYNFIRRLILSSQNPAAIENWLCNAVPPGDDIKNSLGDILCAASPLFRIFQKHTRTLLKQLRKTGYLKSKLFGSAFIPPSEIGLSELAGATAEQLDYYCKEIRRRFTDPSDEKTVTAYTGFLWMRFYSSIYAFRETLRQRLEKLVSIRQSLKSGIKPEPADIDFDDADDLSEDNYRIIQSLPIWQNPEDSEWEQDYIERMVERLADLSVISPKMRALFREISENRKIFSTGRYRQTVIVTRFFDTLTDIVGRLRQAYPEMLIGVCSERGGQYIDIRTGEMINTGREDIRNLFLREETDILICTDAIIDALSFKTADMLINYDLPWMPARLEKRIRKICQTGLKYDRVDIVSICYSGSPEAFVYGQLSSEMAQAYPGLKDRFPGMIPALREEFSDLALGLIQENDLKVRVRNRLDAVISNLSYWEMTPNRFDDLHFKQIQQLRPSRSPVTLAMIWETLYGSKYFQNIGCTILPFGNKQILSVKHIQGIQDGTVITASKDIYESGVKGISSKIYFATYGDPVFDILLNHMDAFGLPGCIKRIEIAKSDATVPLIGYAAACFNEQNEPEKRLITSPLEIEGIVLDEESELTMEDVIPMYEALEAISRDEYQKIYQTDSIIKINMAEGASQLACDYLLLKALIQTFQTQGTAPDNFWDFVQFIESSCFDRESVILSDLPVKTISKLQNLFTDADTLSENDSEIPVQLILSAIDTGCKLADGLNVKKETITTDFMFEKLEAELKSLI